MPRQYKRKFSQYASDEKRARFIIQMNHEGIVGLYASRPKRDEGILITAVYVK